MSDSDLPKAARTGPAAPTPVWSGRLAGLDPRARTLNDSLPVDRRLWPEELALSRAYASSLVEAGVLAAAEAAALSAACDAIEQELASGSLQLEGEDIHSAIEAELTRRAGDPGRKLHTGRSRNDQVSTLLRLRVMRLCDDAIEHVRELERSLVRQARAAGDRAVAAHTHLQPAQPVLLSHWWLAHVAALERDEDRLQEAREAADLMPLGAGAIAGTPLRYDRNALATRLGLSRLATNSLDAVGDRDFALDYLNAGAVLAVHLSRLAEDLVLWCSPAFGWFRAPEGFSTGSSLLPQKRNPDVFELARGKAGRLIANAQRLAIVMKGLPSGYQKDLQEDKEAVFDTADTLSGLLGALAPAVAALEPIPERMEQSLSPDLLAVELADALVEQGVTFREAHEAVARLWAAAERARVSPADLAEKDRLAISPHFISARLAALTPGAAIARRDHGAGTGPGAVAHQLAQAEARLGIGGSKGRGEVGQGVPDTGRHLESLGAQAGAAVEVLDPKAGAPGDPALRQAGAPWGSARDQAGKPGGRSETLEALGGRSRSAPRVASRRQDVGGSRVSRRPPGAPAASTDGPASTNGTSIRRARLEDVTTIAGVMADYVIQGTLLPRPVSELYQCVREFHVAEIEGEVVACAALRLLWDDLGEVRSLAVRPGHQGRGLGALLVEAVLDDARALGVPRVIALTREVGFFERCGFAVASRENLPRKVWTDCVRCPRRHACDETAVVLDLVPGASAAAAAAGRSWTLPIPQLSRTEAAELPIIP